MKRVITLILILFLAQGYTQDFMEYVDFTQDNYAVKFMGSFYMIFMFSSKITIKNKTYKFNLSKDINKDDSQLGHGPVSFMITFHPDDEEIELEIDWHEYISKKTDTFKVIFDKDKSKDITYILDNGTTSIIEDPVVFFQEMINKKYMKIQIESFGFGTLTTEFDLKNFKKFLEKISTEDEYIKSLLEE